jgi:tyrosinase
MSGNGKKISHRGSAFAPAGNGGGCVETGPFKNMTVRLGPLSVAVDPAPARNPRADGYGNNPRCLRRDISNQLSSRYGRTQDIVSLINNARTIANFQDMMQSNNGVHNTGHFTIAGDPGGDFYISPNDPAFWLHHSMIDRTWHIWQIQDYANRQQVIAGGTSMMSFGFGGRQQALSDPVDLGVVGPKVYKISELVSIVGGPFCYVYE